MLRENSVKQGDFGPKLSVHEAMVPEVNQQMVEIQKIRAKDGEGDFSMQVSVKVPASKCEDSVHGVVHFNV